jgi:hypothetical protein
VTIPELLLVVLQVVAVAIVGWSFASLLSMRLFPEVELGLPERALLAIAGFAVLAIASMVVHIATLGNVFNNPFAIPLAAAGALVLAHRKRLWPTQVPWRLVVPAVSVLLTIFVVPVFVAGSSVREGDPSWHMGWTHELLDGQPLPDGPAPEFARNSYPWGWHGILATMVRVVPASTPLLAHEALHVLLVLSLPLAAACLARRIRRDAGWLAAGAAALIAGFGWVSASGPDFVASPTEARYGADMVAASPNAVYEMLPPALPREMGLVLLAAAGMLLMMSVRERRPVLWYAAGVVGGCTGLVSFPMLIPFLAWAGIAALTVGRGWLRSALRAVIPAVALFLLWFGPVVYWYLTEGGFVDISPVVGVEWPVVTALASWGLLVPLIVVGVVVAARDPGPERRVALGFGATSVLLIGLAVARREFGWSLLGNETLLHQGRMWPVAHLLGAAFAGVGLVYIFRKLSERRMWLARGIVAGTFLVGGLSLALAIPGVVELISAREKGFVYGDEDYGPGSFVREAAAHLSKDDVVALSDRDLGLKLFEFSGVSLEGWDRDFLRDNLVRIRYEDLAEAYFRKARRYAFSATHDAGTSEAGDMQGVEHLVTAEYQGRELELWYHPDPAPEYEASSHP